MSKIKTQGTHLNKKNSERKRAKVVNLSSCSIAIIEGRASIRALYSHTIDEGTPPGVSSLIILTYIDDGFTAAPTYELCFRNVCVIMRTFSFYGFLIHKIKSAPEPSQQVRSLGFILDSVSMTVALPQDKIINAIQLCHQVLDSSSLQIQLLAQLIGTLVSLFPACPLGQLHYRSLERVKIASLRNNRWDYSALCVLNVPSVTDIHWWINTIPTTAAPIRRNNPTDVVFCDSSKYAWCGFFEDITANGYFNSQELPNIIAYKELLAIYFALRSFVRLFKGNHILIRSDSVNAVAYVRDMGGMQNVPMDNLAKKIWNFAMEHQFWISVSFIPGVENLDADFGSRHLSQRTEWALPVSVFNALVSKLMLPSIDLFASRLNAKLDRYVSWFPDPYSTDVDAFMLDWRDENPYIFAPFCLISRCLQKIKTDQVSAALLVFPLWPSQHWFPQLLQMLISPIYLLPEHPQIFLPWQTTITQHPLQSILLLSAALVSVTPRTCRSYHQGSQPSSSMVYKNVPKRLTRQLIGNGMFLRVHETLIHICPL